MNVFHQLYRSPFWSQLILGIMAIFVMPQVHANVINNSEKNTTINHIADQSIQNQALSQVSNGAIPNWNPIIKWGAISQTTFHSISPLNIPTSSDIVLNVRYHTNVNRCFPIRASPIG